MKKVLLFLFCILIIISCKNAGKKTSESEKSLQDSVALFNKRAIEPLVSGEYNLKEEGFGKIIELKGESMPVETIFRVSETGMIANDSLLIVKNSNGKYLFMAFSLPDFKYIKSFGIFGRGPHEFLYPKLVRTSEKNVLCYVYDRGLLYSLNGDLELKELSISMPKSHNNTFDDKQIQAWTDSNFVFVESTENGKAIFQFKQEKDTADVSQIYDLSFSKQHNSWASYIGDFGSNSEMNRAVYAYKYFKRLLFLDLQNDTQRTLIFDNENDVKANDAIGTLGPGNVTHYWGMSAQKRYIYVLYSGRTPIEVTNELKNSKGYIFVEQYDWNGNPIRKFKLDHWGYFCVNEAETAIYLVSAYEEQPFIMYRLPE